VLWARALEANATPKITAPTARNIFPRFAIRRVSIAPPLPAPRKTNTPRNRVPAPLQNYKNAGRCHCAEPSAWIDWMVWASMEKRRQGPPHSHSVGLRRSIGGAM